MSTEVREAVRFGLGLLVFFTAFLAEWTHVNTSACPLARVPIGYLSAIGLAGLIGGMIAAFRVRNRIVIE